jgi:hypothetical protein
MANCKGRVRIPKLLVLFFATILGTSVAQTQPSITVQFVAHGMEPKPSEIVQGDLSHEKSPGHIFMIISVPTLHGPKEDAYGFYPRAEKLNGVAYVKAVIKGPGLTRSESRCGPDDDCDPSKYPNLKRMSESDDSVRISITEDERKKIIGEVETWNHMEYRFTTENCIDLVNVVVKDLGYPSPARYRLQTPDKYLGALKKNIAAEDQRREIERSQIQQRAKEDAARQNKNNDCESGVFQEINPNFIWNLTFDGGDLTGQRTDGRCYLRLSRTGETWNGFGTCNGQQRLNLVMRANDGCTQLTSNLAIFCPVLNRK